MKKILAVLLILVSVSCVRIETPHYPETVEFAAFEDAYSYSENYRIDTYAAIGPFLEGESMVRVWIKNQVWNYPEQKYVLIRDIESYLTTVQFHRELERVQKLPRTTETVQFVTTYNGLEITWKMFDEIYSTYARH